MSLSDHGCAHRPSRLANSELEAESSEFRVGVEELRRRYEEGRDLWTEEPIQGDDAAQWLRCYVGVSEESSEFFCGIDAILLVDDREVLVYDKDRKKEVVIKIPPPNDYYGLRRLERKRREA